MSFLSPPSTHYDIVRFITSTSTFPSSSNKSLSYWESYHPYKNLRHWYMCIFCLCIHLRYREYIYFRLFNHLITNHSLINDHYVELDLIEFYQSFFMSVRWRPKPRILFLYHPYIPYQYMDSCLSSTNLGSASMKK